MPQPAFQPSPFLERLIRFLLPFFIGFAPDLEAARAEILETLASYGARSRAELLNAAQIIAFGFAALDMLSEAKATEMSPSMRLRFRGCANNLNRSCQKNEQILARRLACDVPVATPIAEPVNDLPMVQVEEALQQAQAKLDTTRNRLSGARPTTGPYAIPASRQDPDKCAWGRPILQALAADIAAPLPPAP